MSFGDHFYREWIIKNHDLQKLIKEKNKEIERLKDENNELGLKFERVSLEKKKLQAKNAQLSHNNEVNSSKLVNSVNIIPNYTKFNLFENISSNLRLSAELEEE